jgi:hypothetical protein
VLLVAQAPSPVAGVVNAADFGMSPAASGTVNTAALQAAIKAVPSGTGGIVDVPAGTYQMGQGVFWDDKPVILRGQGAGRQPGSGTRLVFPPTVNYGIAVQTGRDGLGAGSRIENLHLVGTASGVVDSSDGIRLSAHSGQIMNVFVEGFGGNGIHIASGSPHGGDPINANNCLVMVAVVNNNKQHGLFVEGANAQGCTFINVDATYNWGWGIYENGFLGNVYIAPHVAGNLSGGYRIGDISRSNSFIGAYAETDSTTGLQLDAGGAGANVFHFTAMDNTIVDNTVSGDSMITVYGFEVKRGLRATAGSRFVCVDTQGVLFSSATPCSGQ